MTPAQSPKLAGSAEIVAAMSALAAAQGLRDRAFEGYRMWLAGDAGVPGGLDGWAAEEVEPHFRSCSLVFDHVLGYPFVDTRLDICVRDTSGAFLQDLRPVGYYRLITLPDGTVDDDYFVIDVPKPADR